MDPGESNLKMVNSNFDFLLTFDSDCLALFLTQDIDIGVSVLNLDMLRRSKPQFEQQLNLRKR